MTHPNHTWNLLVATLAFGTWSASGLAAQTAQLWRSTTSAGGSARGFDAGCDVNADGIPDVVFNVSSPSPGFVQVASGLDGASLLTIPTTPGGAVATDVAMLRDLDGDDRCEIAISRAVYRDGANVQLGRVEIYSGATGGLLRAVNGTNAGGSFGDSIFNGGDFDGDGLDDLVVWQKRSTQGSIIETSILSGADLSLIRLLPTDGFSPNRVVPTGDATGDGRADLLRPGVFPGAALLDGQSAAQFGTYTSPGLVEFTSPLGDVDGDGRADHVLMELIDPISSIMRASVFSSATGTSLHLGPNIRYVTGFIELGAIGDVTGDCISDYAIYGPTFGSTTGIKVHSGATGALVAAHVIGTANIMRYRVKRLGDVDGDGFPEVCIADNGLIAVIDLGLTGSLPSLRTVGSACPGSAGNLALSSASGCPRVGTTMALIVRNALPNAPLVQNLGTLTSQPLDGVGMPGCFLLASGDGIAVFGAADANGTASTTSFAIPNDVALVGLELASQAICVDATANAAGLTTSRGMLIRVGS